MSKMKQLAAELEELRRCGENLIAVSETLTEIFSGHNETANESITAETSAKPQKEITFETVRAVLAEKSRDGYTAEVKSLINKYGADKLSDVNPEQYTALLADAEVIGNAG